MNTKNKLFFSCNEANHTCDKTQYDDASFWEKIKLNLHLIYCRACRKYSKNNAKLTKIMRSNELEHLENSEKEILQANFNKELVKQK